MPTCAYLLGSEQDDAAYWAITVEGTYDLLELLTKTNGDYQLILFFDELLCLAFPFSSSSCSSRSLSLIRLFYSKLLYNSSLRVLLDTFGYMSLFERTL